MRRQKQAIRAAFLLLIWCFLLCLFINSTSALESKGFIKDGNSVYYEVWDKGRITVSPHTTYRMNNQPSTQYIQFKNYLPVERQISCGFVFDKKPIMADLYMWSNFTAFRPKYIPYNCPVEKNGTWYNETCYNQTMVETTEYDWKKITDKLIKGKTANKFYEYGNFSVLGFDSQKFKLVHQINNSGLKSGYKEKWEMWCWQGTIDNPTWKINLDPWVVDGKNIIHYDDGEVGTPLSNNWTSPAQTQLQYNSTMPVSNGTYNLYKLGGSEYSVFKFNLSGFPNYVYNISFRFYDFGENQTAGQNNFVLGKAQRLGATGVGCGFLMPSFPAQGWGEFPSYYMGSTCTWGTWVNSTIPRTVGWHRVQLDIRGTENFTYYLDGQFVMSQVNYAADYTNGTLNWERVDNNDLRILLDELVVYNGTLPAPPPPESEPPAWSNNQSHITATYNASFLSHFNITWTDDTAVTNVSIEGNWSGTPTNYSMANPSGDVWNYSVILPIGSHYWKSYARDATGNQNITDTWTFVIAKGTPVINLTLNSTSSNITLAQDTYIWINGSLIISDSNARLELYIDGVLKANSSVIGNYTNFTTIGLKNISLYYIATQNYTTSRLTYWVTVIDVLLPTWSNNQSSIPAVYSPTSLSNFSINWIDNVAISSVLIEGNWSGTATNYTMGTSWLYQETANITNCTGVWSPEYNCSFVNDTIWTGAIGRALEGGNEAWIFLNYTKPSGANNNSVWQTKDGAGIRNLTLVPCYDTFQNFIYLMGYSYRNGESISNWSCWDGSWHLLQHNPSNSYLYEESIFWYFNDSIYSSILPAGSYYWKSYANDTSNNWNRTDKWLFTIAQATPDINLTLNSIRGNVTINVGDSIWLNGSTVTGDSSAMLELYLDGVLQNSNKTVANYTLFPALGLKNVTLNYLTTQNYTAGSVTYWVTVGDWVAPAWSNNKSSTPAVYDAAFNSRFNITWQDNVAVMNVTLESNYSGTPTNYSMINSSATVWNYSMGILPVGSYYWKSYANDTTGNENSTDIWYFTISRATPVIVLTVNGSASATSIDEDSSIWLNGSLTTGDSDYTLEMYIDNVLKATNTSGPVTNYTLFDTPGAFNVTLRHLQTQNYTEYNKSLILTVNDKTAPAWSNNQSYLTSVYNASFLAHFNITWTDNVGIDKVLFESNYSGMPTNYTMVNSTATKWNYSAILPTGSHYWKSYANDTAGNQNQTDIWYFTVLQPLVINAQNIYNGSALLVFNATISNSTYVEHQSTTNGNITFTKSGIFDIYVTAPNYLYDNDSVIVTLNTVTTPAHTSYLFQHNLTVHAKQKISQINISNFTVYSPLQSNYTDTGTAHLLMDAGVSLLNITYAGWWPVFRTVNLTPSSSSSITFNLTNVNLTVYAYNTSGHSLEGYQVNVTSDNYGKTLSITGTNMSFLLNNGTYTIWLNASGYAFSNKRLYLNGTYPLMTNTNFTAAVPNSLFLNFYDEDTDLPVLNVAFELIGMAADNYSTTNGIYTFSDLADDNYEIRYTSSGYIGRSYYITVGPRTVNDVNLYLINSSTGSLITFTISDESDNKISNATVKVLRYFINSNEYNIVEMTKSDEQGGGGINLVKDTVWYKFIIDYQGKTVLETLQQRIFSDTIAFRISLIEDALKAFRDVNNIYSNMVYQNSTQTIRYTWNDAGNIIRDGCLLVEERGPSTTTVICNNCSSAISDTLICTIDKNSSKSFFASGTLDGFLKNTLIQTFSTTWAKFGNSGLFYAVIMVGTAALIGIWNPIIALFFALFGLITMSLVGFIFIPMKFVITLTAIGLLIAYKLKT